MTRFEVYDFTKRTPYTPFETPLSLHRLRLISFFITLRNWIFFDKRISLSLFFWYTELSQGQPDVDTALSKAYFRWSEERCVCVQRFFVK